MKTLHSIYPVLNHIFLESLGDGLCSTQQSAAKREIMGVSITYAVIYHILASRIVVDVDRNAAQRGNLGGEFREAAIILSLYSDEESI